MIKLAHFIAPLAVASVAACSSGGSTHPHPVTDAPKAGGDSGGGIDAPAVCSIAATIPDQTIPTTTTFYKNEKDAFANSATPSTNTTTLGELVAFNNTGDATTGDQTSLQVFENKLQSNLPTPGTFTIGALADGGSVESDPFMDTGADPNGPRMLVLGFDLATNTPGDLYLGVAGTINIMSDSEASYKATATGVTLVHFDPSGMASADNCQTTLGTITVSAAPVTQRTPFTGRDEVADQLAARRADVMERIHNGTLRFQKPE